MERYILAAAWKYSCLVFISLSLSRKKAHQMLTQRIVSSQDVIIGEIESPAYRDVKNEGYNGKSKKVIRIDSRLNRRMRFSNRGAK
jgi:hypothetical protein